MSKILLLAVLICSKCSAYRQIPIGILDLGEKKIMIQGLGLRDLGEEKYMRAGIHDDVVEEREKETGDLLVNESETGTGHLLSEAEAPIQHGGELENEEDPNDEDDDFRTVEILTKKKGNGCIEKVSPKEFHRPFFRKLINEALKQYKEADYHLTRILRIYKQIVNGIKFYIAFSVKDCSSGIDNCMSGRCFSEVVYKAPEIDVPCIDCQDL